MIPYPPPASATAAGLVTTLAQTFAGAKTFNAAPVVDTLTARGPMFASSTKQVASLAAMTNGQLMIGSTGADPVLATLTGTANRVSVTNGAGSIQIDLVTSPVIQSLTFLAGSSQAVINMTPSDTFTTAQYHDFLFQPIYTGTTRILTAAMRFMRTSSTDGTYNGAIGFITRATGAGFFEAMRLDHNGCILVPGSITPAATGTRALWLGNGTAPTSSPADMVGIYSVDASAGNATLGLRTEAAVVTESVTSDRTLQVVINDTVYKFCLKA